MFTKNEHGKIVAAERIGETADGELVPINDPEAVLLRYPEGEVISDIDIVEFEITADDKPKPSSAKATGK